MTSAARALAMALGLVLVLAPRAGAGLADRVGATFAEMAPDFIEMFAPLEGLIVSVERGTVYLDLGERAGVRVGQEFTVFRKGEMFRHPITGKPLGRYEQVLGHTQVQRVAPQFAEATFVPMPDRPPPRAEDGVRISRGRIRIAVTPVLDLSEGGGDLRRVPFLVAVTLERSKRFRVVDPLEVAEKLAAGEIRVEEVLARPERAEPVARSLEVAGWLVPTLLTRRGVTYLDVTLVSAYTGAALLSRRQALLPAVGVEEQRFPWEPRAED